MSDEMPSYDLAVVRDLILAAFTADDLRRLVLFTSRTALKPLIHEFGSGDGLAAMAEKTTVFCQTRDCLPELLAEVKRANPRQYARFEGRLAVGGSAGEATPRATRPSVPAAGGTTYVTHIRDARGVAIGDGARVIMAPEDDDEGEQEP